MLNEVFTYSTTWWSVTDWRKSRPSATATCRRWRAGPRPDHRPPRWCGWRGILRACPPARVNDRKLEFSRWAEFRPAGGRHQSGTGSSDYDLWVMPVNTRQPYGIARSSGAIPDHRSDLRTGQRSLPVRGACTIAVKGKGEMKVWWVTGETL